VAAFASGTPPKTSLRFLLSFPASVRADAADGRVFVMISRSAKPEPRLQLGFSETIPFFAADVDGLRPGQWTAIGEEADSFPLDGLGALPAGDYFVQGLLNIYTTFPRADGRVVKMHMDQWEGQSFPISPGNLFSEVQRIHVDPRAGGTVRLSLDRAIPSIPVPPDTDFVKHVRFESPLLSKFWGRPIWIGATVLLPRGYDGNRAVRYPVNYEQGHFSVGAPGGFEEDLPEDGRPSSPEGKGARKRNDFTRAWLSDDFPRMLFVTFQHPTPFYDDSYAVDSPNSGPYGQAILTELIPYVESRFRAISEPWARVLTGGSTGGWEALALQIFHPDFFGGTFAACPDPVDFRALQIVNIYEWDNAWRLRRGWSEVPLPGERNTDGLVLSTMEMQLKYERARGPRGRSGEQWDAWQAAYGPVGDDGYLQPLFDPQTGAIDRKVADYWRDHSDLRVHLEKHWSELAPRLSGKLHITAGEMDTYYLNNAVRLLDEFLDKARPAYGGSILYGARQPHCWVGPLSLPQRILQIAEYAASRAPRDADRAWWQR
jgi:hypothetical protein